jgi:hypothetical protein
MTSDRARAYGQLMATLREAGPAKLHADELDLIREAADVLLFCDDLEHASSAHELLGQVIAVAEGMVSSQRWTAQRLEQLIDDLAACGPGPRVLVAGSR